MAITFVNAGTYAQGTGSVSPGLPASMNDNDLMLLVMETGLNEAVAAITGWTEVTNSPVIQGTNTRLTVRYRFRQTGDTAPATGDPGNHISARIIAFRGVDLTTPFDVNPTTGSNGTATTTMTMPSITPTSAACMIVGLNSAQDDAALTTNIYSAWTAGGLVSITECIDNGHASGDDGSLGGAYGIKTTAGATGTITATHAGSVQQANMTIALRPAVTGFDLDAQPGSYTLTGAVARLARDIPFNAGPGAYTLTGFQARIARDFPLNAAPGAYALTGSAAGLLSARMLSALAGSYVLTGSDARLARDIFLNAAPGTYATTGFLAGMLANRAIQADPGAYVLAGMPAALARDISINAAPGTYVLTGFDATLLFDGGVGAVFDLDAQPGSYVLTGVAASLVRDISINAAPGVYAITGQQAALLAERVMNAAPGSYALTGVVAATVADRVLKADPGGYSVSGFVAGLISERQLNAAPGSYIIVGSPATLIVPGAPPIQVRGTKWYVSRPGFYG